MNYGAFSTEKLKKELKRKKQRLEWLKSLDTAAWGCLSANQSEERKVEREIREFESELSSRELKRVWI